MTITLQQDFFEETDGVIDNKTMGAFIRLIAAADEKLFVSDAVADAINGAPWDGDQEWTAMDELEEHGFLRATVEGWNVDPLFKKGLVSR